MIFARGVSGPLTSLVKKLDEATQKNASAEMGSFVVFCTNEGALSDKLKQLAETEKLKHIVLSTFDRGGPDGYDVASDAEVTVVMYVERTVKVNRVYRKGELTEKDVAAILADLSKILPSKSDEKK